MAMRVNGSLTGSWRTVSVTPQGKQFPIASVTFDKHYHFTATSQEDEGQRTCTGTYKWNGFRLVLDPSDWQRRSYPGRRRLDGTLALTHTAKAAKVRAIMERTGAK